MNTSENRVLSRVYGNGRGYAFSSSDFIDKALLTLTKKKIRKFN